MDSLFRSLAAGFPRAVFPRAAASVSGPVWSIFLLLLFAAASVSGKLPLSILGAYVSGEDSAYCESLARDLGQTLADDTSLLVFDLRKKHGSALDSAHAQGRLNQAAFLATLGSGQVRWGILVACSEAKGDLACRLEALDLKQGKGRLIDTLRFLPEAASKRKQLGQVLARPILAHFFPTREQFKSPGKLRIRPPAMPAMLVRDLQILQRGPISEIPLGATLVVGDASQLMEIGLENLHYVLYPRSSYTYLLPKVVQLNAGALGILKGEDTSSLAGKLRQAGSQATTLDQSNLIWRNLSKLAALDSSNLVWKTLGKVSSLDSNNILLNNMLTKGIGKAAALDSSNLLFKALGNVTSLDSSNMLLRTLIQVAAMDSSNLVWKGLGQVSALDSNNLIWKKLGQIASTDSNSIWRKLGLLAFQDSTMVLTPSLLVRGLPDAILIRHRGSVTTLEVVKGSMQSLPLLSSRGPEAVGALRTAETRGFTLKQTRMSALRADRIMKEFESVNQSRGSRTLAMFLPGKLFSVGASLRTADRPIQSFIAGEMREMDMEMGVLSSEKEGWNDAGATFRTGSQEAGCYLCAPDRIGP